MSNTKMPNMTLQQAMNLAESDEIHGGAELHQLPMCAALIVLHDEVDRLMNGIARMIVRDHMAMRTERKLQQLIHCPHNLDKMAPYPGCAGCSAEIDADRAYQGELEARK